ncbi:MAG: putative DNA primase [Prokaryotic dsDNA virus sp.]|nr:MAG: putative DNA primase [Prokaryotic dsDNA virus sp.]|tara:strand:- start:16940 stop:17809 length:870 start_codon:yes stop_codon:yes gene_type:complete
MNIRDVFNRLGVPWLDSGHHHCRPGWIQIDCPFCESQGKFHMGYNLSSPRFHCWVCRGHSVSWVLSKLGMPVNDAKQVAQVLSREELDLDGVELRGKLVEPAGRGKLKEAHRSYLQRRGFKPSEIRSVWGVEGIGPFGLRLSWRLYIPIISGGRRLSWTTRSLNNTGQRYISASPQQEAVNHKHLVYGIDHCFKSIVIVEGPTDAWRVGPGAGALFGLAWSTHQLETLSKIPNRFICFDNSMEARAASRELAGQLNVFPGTTSIVELDAKDPGCASEKEIQQLREEAEL